MQTGDAAAWRAIQRHPAVQRARAVQAVVSSPRNYRPTSEIIEELCAVYPRGAPIDDWMSALMYWLEAGVSVAAVSDAIQATLLEWPAAVTRPARNELWPRVVALLVTRGEPGDAADALLRAPIVAEMVTDGQANILVDAWHKLRPEDRHVANQELMADLLRKDPRGVQLVNALKAPPPRDRPSQARGLTTTGLKVAVKPGSFSA